MKILSAVWIYVLAPCLFIGIINKSKALWAGRKGASIRQPGSDLFKLVRKGEVISKTTSFVFRLTPPVMVASTVFAAMMIPLPGQQALISFPGDFVLFAYAFALARFILVAAALDTGSAFEGMGAAREVTFASIVEPAFFMLLATWALATGKTSFAAIFAMLDGNVTSVILVKLLGSLALFIMILVEGSRVPVDDPATHLELTMIHEVMILDYSGPDLAFVEYASFLKIVVLVTLLANIFLPTGLGLSGGLLCYMMIFVAVALTIAAVESLVARQRLSRVPQFIFLMTALGITAFAIVLFFRYGVVL